MTTGNEQKPDSPGPCEEDGVIFHLAPKELWEAAGETYIPPTYDQDGFVHATKDPAMLIGIANHFYKSAAGDFVLLHLRESKMTHQVKYEAAMAVGDTKPPDAAQDAPKPVLFPHIYGPINRSGVEKVTPVQRATDGSFLRFAHD